MCRWTSRGIVERHGHASPGSAAPGLALVTLAFLACALPGFAQAAVPVQAPLPAQAPPLDDATPEWLLLAVKLNGAEQPETVQAVRTKRGLAVPRSAWAAWQLKPPTRPGVDFDGNPHEWLQDAHGLRWRIDDASQTLLIDAPPASFAGGRYSASGSLAPVVSTQTLGGYLNYDTQVQQSQLAGTRDRRAYGLVETGAFAEGGYGSNTLLGLHDETGTRWVRLDTGWNVDRPDKMTTLRLGDSVSQGGAWGRSLRYGGVQWSTNFATRPGFLSFPLPTLRGEASLPSTLDLYINNSQRFQSPLPPGPFELSDLPIVTGQGQIRMVVKDVLGREQVVVQPYYVSPALLRPALTSWSFDLGSLREDYGVKSSSYGRLMMSAGYREGITETFTREWRVEAMGSQQTAGAAGVWMFPAFGTVSAAAALGRDELGSGAMLSAGAEHQAADWSGSVQWRGAQRDFVQQGQPHGTAARSTLSVAAGTNIGRGSVGASYVQQSPWQGDSTRIVSLNYGIDLGPLGYLGLFALRGLGAQGGLSLAFSLTFSLDPLTSASATVNRNRDAHGSSQSTTLQLQRNAPPGPGFGYQISADRGVTDRYQALGTLQTERATFQGGFSRYGAMQDVRIGASGGLAWVGDSVLMSRHIDGSFAVVEVSDYEGVRVLQDNQPIGRTDAKGRALITGLRGYQRNRISIDPSDLPFDAEVDALEVMLTPSARSGMQVNFPVQRARAATFRLVRADGSPVPAGSTVRVAGRERSFPVGMDGMGFASGLSAHNTLVARWTGAECQAQLAFGADSDEVPDLGTLVCK